MRRLWIVVAALVIVPIVEIAVLIGIGQVIGLGWTLLLMLVTSFIGGWLLRKEGGKAWRAFQADLADRKPPGNTATDGLLVLIGGIFMLVPGFVSDVIGLFFILPPTRRLARAFALRVIAPRMSAAASTTLFGPRRVHVRYGDPFPSTPPSGAQPTARRTAEAPGDAIEGEIVP
jgi:UPF0716 protein FxsA